MRDWDCYLCRVNDEPASIFLDLSFAQTAPDVTRPLLLFVWMQLLSVRPDGLTTGDENELLFVIEDQLVKEMERLDAIYVGRITNVGRREFYFYAANDVGFENAVASVAARFPERTFEPGIHDDPGWQQYFDVLFPGEEDMQRIQNSRVLDSLERHGDMSLVPREVRHWIYFPTQTHRRRFISKVLDLGFTLQSETEQPDSDEERYGCCVARVETVDSDHIDRVVVELFRLSKREGGAYDGWETQVMA